MEEEYIILPYLLQSDTTEKLVIGERAMRVTNRKRSGARAGLLDRTADEKRQRSDGAGDCMVAVPDTSNSATGDATEVDNELKRATN